VRAGRPERLRVRHRAAVGWKPLTELIGRPELAEDPEWATPEARLPQLSKMFQLIEEWSSTLPKWEVLERLNAHNIPCGPILSTREIIEDESLAPTRWS
jgi:formyl-CoA transferase